MIIFSRFLDDLDADKFLDSYLLAGSLGGRGVNVEKM
jgi:hypothetical protein